MDLSPSLRKSQRKGLGVCVPDEQQQQREWQRDEPVPWEPKGESPFGGPRAPTIDKPDTSRLLKRMRSTDRDGSKKYRQRSGEWTRRTECKELTNYAKKEQPATQPRQETKI